MRKEAEDAEAIIDRNQHYALAREFLAVISVGDSAASRKAAAMNPDHDRKPVLRRLGRGPDIEIKAVFAERGKFGLVDRGGRVGRLPAGVAELLGFAHAGPGSGRLRRLPAQIADRWSGKRNSAIYPDIRI